MLYNGTEGKHGRELVALGLIGHQAAAHFFDKHVPGSLVEELGRIVIGGYQDAEQSVMARGFGPAEAHDIVPYERRALIEQGLGTLPARFPGRVQVYKRPNRRSNHWHGEMYMGQVVLTVSKIASPYADIRPALFRETLARSTQLSLFEVIPLPPEGTALFAVLVHGSQESRPLRPSFLRIAFPQEDGAQLSSFDVMRRYPSLFTEWATVSEEEVEPEPRIRVRPAARVKTNEGEA